MKDEALLAAILLAAAALLLVLTMIMLYIVLKTIKRSGESKEKSSEIPANHYENSAFQADRNSSSVTQSNNDTRVTYYSNDTGERHKADWPSSYNMYAVSRSYAFPKTGDYSEQSIELGSRAQASTLSSSVASRNSTFMPRGVNDKSFSEEVFEGINSQESTSYTNSATLPMSDSTSQHETRVWKSRTPSESASVHSHEASSTHGSIPSHSRDYRVLTEQRSYYTSFKPRNASASTDSTSHADKNSDLGRERIATHSINATGTKKVFTFDLK